MERVEIHVFVHQAPPSADPRLDEVLCLLRNIQRKENTIMADLTALTAAVERSVTVEESAKTLIEGIAAELAAAKTDPVALQALQDKLTAEADVLSAAIVANTPAAPAPAPTP